MVEYIESLSADGKHSNAVGTFNANFIGKLFERRYLIPAASIILVTVGKSIQVASDTAHILGDTMRPGLLLGKKISFQFEQKLQNFYTFISNSTTGASCGTIYS